MTFQPWRDYLQLASIIQTMEKAEISQPPPLRDLLLSPAKRTEGYAMNQQNDHVESNSFLPFLPDEPMGHPYLDMNSNLLPTGFYGQDNSPLPSAEDQATSFPASKTQPNLLPTYYHKQTNSHPTKTSVEQFSSLPQGEPSHGSMCYFCKHNGESRRIYMGHNLKDEQGRVVCPILRMYSCSLCGATGDISHTKKYCPLNKDKHCLYKKSGRNSAGRKVKR